MLINELFYDKMWVCFLSPDGNKLLYGNRKKKIINLKSKETIETPYATGPIKGHFNVDGSLFCSLSFGGTLNVIRTDDGTLVYKRRINTQNTFYNAPVFFGDYIYLLAQHHYSGNKKACLYRIDYSSACKPELIYTFEGVWADEFFVSSDRLIITLLTYGTRKDSLEGYEVYYLSDVASEPVCRIKLASLASGRHLFRATTEEIVTLTSHPILADVTVVSVYSKTGKEKYNFFVPFPGNAIFVYDENYILISHSLSAKVVVCDLDRRDYKITDLAPGELHKTDNDRYFIVSNMYCCGLYKTEDE